jgi:hypothetical protein
MSTYLSIIQSVLLDKTNYKEALKQTDIKNINSFNFLLISFVSTSYSLSIFHSQVNVSPDSIVIFFLLLFCTIIFFYTMPLFISLFIDYQLHHVSENHSKIELVIYSRISTIIFFLALPLNILFVNGLHLSMGSFLSTVVCYILYIYLVSGGIKEIYSIESQVSLVRSLFLFFLLPIFLLLYFTLQIISIIGF